MSVYSKITSVITAVFAACIGIAIGLTCYYWVWLKLPHTIVEKSFIMGGFALLGLICMLFGGFLTYFAWDLEYSGRPERIEVEMGIIGIIFCGGVPGIMYIIGLIINAVHASRYSRRSSYSGTTTPAKKKAPDYDIDNDPRVVRKKSDGGSSGPARKKVSFRNDDGGHEGGSSSGKKRLIYKTSSGESSSGKKRLVYKTSSGQSSSGKKKLVYKGKGK